MATQHSNTKLPVKINYFKVKGISFDPLNIIRLDIFEGLDYPGITGNITFQDYTSFKEHGGLFAGDTFEISFGRDEDPSVELRLMVSEAYGDVAEENALSNSMSFGFCSEWLVEGFTRKRSRPWSDKKISEIVEELIVECGGEPGIIIETKQTLERFVSPYWSPLATIKYLMSFATDTADSGGYLLWTDMATNKVNFIPVGTLKHRTGHYGQVGFDMKMFTKHQRSAERIYSQSMAHSFDVIRYADMGLGRSRLVGFNFDTSEFNIADKRVDSYVQNHLSQNLPLNDRFMGKVYRTTRNSWLFNNTNELIRDGADELIDARLNTKFNLMYADMLKINMVTTGEAHKKRAGRLVRISFPSSDEAKTSENKQYSGTYLIRNIRHTISGMEYGNVMTVVSDGYKEIDRADMIDWNGGNNVFDNIYNGDKYDIDAVDIEDEQLFIDFGP